MNSNNGQMTGSTVSKDPLMQPFQLRHLRLKKRIMSTSHTMLFAVDSAPQQRYQLYHEEKAMGGIVCGSISRQGRQGRTRFFGSQKNDGNTRKAHTW